MAKIGFNNQLYIEKQTESINKAIGKFGGKLYLEFGGKLFDDYHAARVLPGFKPDTKVQMLKSMADMAEIVIVINSGDIEKNKTRGDLGITYGRVPRHRSVRGQRRYLPVQRSVLRTGIQAEA